jgi:hypothetical protein
MGNLKSTTVLGILVLGLPFSLAACTSDVSTATSDATAGSTTTSSGGGQGSTGQGGVGQGGTGQGGIGQGGAGQGGVGQGGTGQGGIGQGGTGQGGMGQGGGGQCAPTGNGCTDCLYMTCMNVYCECFGSTDCTDIRSCAQNCQPGDMQCANTCYMLNSTGLAEFLLVSDCAGTQCQASCPGAMPVNLCSVCLANQCEPQFEGCYADAECVALIDCIRGCPPGDMVCQQQCTTQHQTGLPEAQALRMCSVANCTPPCN